MWTPLQTMTDKADDRVLAMRSIRKGTETTMCTSWTHNVVKQAFTNLPLLDRDRIPLMKQPIDEAQRKSIDRRPHNDHVHATYLRANEIMPAYVLVQVGRLGG